MKRFVIFVFLLLIIISIGFSSNNTEDMIDSHETIDTIATPTAEMIQPPIFTSGEIPDSIYETMLGNSIPLAYESQVDRSSLSYLQLSHFDFEGKIQVGEMIVNRKLGSEVLAIFQQLYEIQYPIEKIRLIDAYHADDEQSMADNNTSCFCYRVVAGTSYLSNHAYRLLD